MFILTVISQGHTTFAKLLEAGAALFTDSIGIHHATNRAEIAFAEFADLIADPDHAPDNFVTRNAGVSRPSPFVSCNVQVGMANPAEKDLEVHIGGCRFSSLK